MSLSGEFAVDLSDQKRMLPQLEDSQQQILTKYDRGELGFLDVPEQSLSEIEAFADDILGDNSRFAYQVVVGIGGSSLGARALYNALRLDESESGLMTMFLENVDPADMERKLDDIEIDKTLFTIVTKSGTTLETMSKFAYLADIVEAQGGEEAVADQFVAITGPTDSRLREIAVSRGLTTFDVPENVGGRYSVLTPVGLVPLAVAGAEIRRLVAGAELTRSNALTRDIGANPLAQATGDIYASYRRGLSELVMMTYAERLEDLVEWFRQLWAESLGKKQRSTGDAEGMTPISAVGTIDQHSQVQLYIEGPPRQFICFLDPGSSGSELKVPEDSLLPNSLEYMEGASFQKILEAELDATRRSLREAERPTVTWEFSGVDELELGGFILGWEYITALMAELIDVNAFNQPGVEAGKRIAEDILAGRDSVESEPVTSENQGGWTGGVVVESEDR